MNVGRLVAVFKGLLWAGFMVSLGLIGFGVVGEKVLLMGGAGLLILCVVLFLVFLKRIPFGEVWVIDRAGKLQKYNPGYRLIFTFWELEKIRKKVKTLEYNIPLFGERETWIDLFGGGKAILLDPEIWILVKDPLKAVSSVEDFEVLVREMAEHRVNGKINSMTVDDVIQMKAAEEVNQRITTTLREGTDIPRVLEEIGIEYKGFTVSDFDYSEDVTKKRRENYEAGVNVEIAQKERVAKAHQVMGMDVDMVSVALGKDPSKPEDKFIYPEDEAKKRATDYTSRQMAIDGRSFTDIRVPQGTTLEGLVALAKRIPIGGNGKGKEEEGDAASEKEIKKSAPGQSFWREKRPMEKLHNREKKE